MKSGTIAGTAITGGPDGAVNFWTLKEGNVDREFKRIKTPKSCIFCIQKGCQNSIYVGGFDGVLRCFGYPGLEAFHFAKVVLKRRLLGHKGIEWMCGLDFCDEKKLLASSSSDRTVKLWNGSVEEEKDTQPTDTLVTQTPDHSFYHHDESFVWDVKFLSTSSNLIASSDAKGSLHISDITKLIFVRQLRNNVHKSNVMNISCDKTKNVLYSCEKEGKIQVFDVHNDRQIKVLTSEHKLYSILYLDHYEMLVGEHDNDTRPTSNLMIYDTRTWKVKKTIASHTACIRRILAVEGGERFVMTASFDHTVKIWNRKKDYKMEMELKERKSVYGLEFLSRKRPEEKRQEKEDLRERTEFLFETGDDVLDKCRMVVGGRGWRMSKIFLLFCV